MAKRSQNGPKFHIKPFVDFVGLKAIVEAIGPKGFIEALGPKRVLKLLGPEIVIEFLKARRVNLTLEQEQALKERLS